MRVSGCVADMDRYRGPLIATSLQQLVRGPTRGGSQCIQFNLKQFNHFVIEIWTNVSRLSGGPISSGP